MAGRSGRVLNVRCRLRSFEPEPEGSSLRVEDRHINLKLPFIPSGFGQQHYKFMNKIQIVILAAGLGKRMGNKDLPKVLIPFKGKPLIKHLLESIKDSGICDKPAIVVGQRPG